MTGQIDRFKDRDDQIEAMLSQKTVRGNRSVAEALVDAGELVAFAPGEDLMHQGANDDHCWFILAGSVDLIVNGERLPYGRGAGDVVGEFAAINPRLCRTATVTAREPVVALRCGSAALKGAGRGEPELWRLLAVELTHKIEQRNQLIASVNERPRIFMIASESRREIAQQIRLALLRNHDVELWNVDDLVPPGEHQVDVLHEQARAADFGVVLADPDDLCDPPERASGDQWQTVRFELGYVMSELSRHRTLVMVPEWAAGAAPRLFKGMQPMTYSLPDEGVPTRVALARAIEAITEFVAERKARSRLRSTS
ncbi:nucleotide-binding protein [Sphingomonas sp. RRHST34]|uniref:Nucleotide-binding protein n=1 Tax=Sphingomonas citri TaxID=2862499 RepID=A0ABS7BM65_9SPHN|nr:TIR domain-containing protein [Sphingomonas citri]MBW6530524.1 nucleotide-binding protein [Sphingomonas citri]